MVDPNRDLKVTQSMPSRNSDAGRSQEKKPAQYKMVTAIVQRCLRVSGKQRTSISVETGKRQKTPKRLSVD